MHLLPMSQQHSSFRSTWSSLFSRFHASDHHHRHHHSSNRNNSNSSHNINSLQQQRRPSHVSSCGSIDTTFSSRSGLSDSPRKLTKVKSLFQISRRGSDDSVTSSISMLSLATTLVPTTVENDPFLLESSSHGVNKERFLSLYELALDEIKYAEDSFGSPYYAGDRVTAREAIDGCANALRQLHPTIELAMAPRIGDLESKFKALPRLADDMQ